MSNHHNTKQKALILQVLQENPHHITAEEIINLLHTSSERVGRATVYRFLHELEGTGNVKKYTLGEKNTAYYQYIDEASSCHGHYHLMCDVCGRLEHLDSSVATAFAKSARESYGFEIDCTKTVFYGKCKECVNK